MGGDDSKGTFQVETLQDGFGNGPANLRFRSSSELINQDEALAVARFQHHLHVGQVGRVGTQVVFNTLLVADVNEDVAEDAGMASFVHGHQHAALEHVLQQSDGFQADGLTSGVRTGNQQDAFLAGEDNVQGNHFLAVLGQRHLQQGMYRLEPVDNLLVFERGFQAFYLDAEQCLGTDKVNLGQEFVGLQDGGYLRTDRRREIGQDTDNLPPLFSLQFPDAVVGFHHFRRFDEHRLSGGRLVVYDTFDFPFHARGYRNDQAAVAHGGGYIFVDVSFRLGRP